VINWNLYIADNVFSFDDFKYIWPPICFVQNHCSCCHCGGTGEHFPNYTFGLRMQISQVDQVDRNVPFVPSWMPVLFIYHHRIISDRYTIFGNYSKSFKQLFSQISVSVFSVSVMAVFIGGQAFC
jgi:hypothetical protein